MLKIFYYTQKLAMGSERSLGAKIAYTTFRLNSCSIPGMVTNKVNQNAGLVVFCYELRHGAALIPDNYWLYHVI